MAKIGKFPRVWDVVVMLLLFFVTQLVATIVLQVCGLMPPTVSAIDTVPIDTYLAEQEALGRYVAILYPLTMAIPLVLLWLYVRLRGGKKPITIGCSGAGFNPSVILVGIVWLLSSQLVLEPLVALLPEVDAPGVGLGVWAYITTIVMAPVIEELLCRGVLLETLRKRWSVWVAIAVSALFFGLIHAAPQTIVVATVAGLIFGTLYVRTKSIFASMIVHSINNSLAFALIVLGKQDVTVKELIGNDTIYYVVYALAVVIFVAASVEAFVKLRKLESDSEEVADENEKVVEE